MKKISIKFSLIVGVLLVPVFFVTLICSVKADELQSRVLENPYNKLAAQLNSKGEELSKREQALNALEKKLEKSYDLVLLIIGLLFLLIMVNFALDYHRRKTLLSNK